MNWIDKKLYLILDTSYIDPENIIPVAEECCEAGVDIVQFRDKTLSDKDKFLLCAKLRQIITIPFIINDRLDIALAVNADGVHLGQDDMPVAIARSILAECGRTMIIGRSTHSLQQARHAEREGVDYIAIGPLLPTQTKPDYPAVGINLAQQVTNMTALPVFAIGGVNLNTIDSIVDKGISRTAVVSAILTAQNKQDIINRLKNRL